MRIAAVDDEPHVLERFERMVSDKKELELCGLFETGEQLLAYLKEDRLSIRNRPAHNYIISSNF